MNIYTVPTLVVVAMLSANAVLAQVQLVVNQTNLQDYGLTLIGPASVGYQPLLQQLTMGQDTTALQPAVPFSVIVQNRGSQAAAVLGVRFHVAAENGRTLQHLHYIDDAGRSRAYHLRPGENRFVAIIRSFSDAVAQKRLGSLRQLASYPNDLNLLKNFSRMKTITVTLDSVAFDDGGFAGPDVGDEYLRLGQKLAAEQFVCHELRSVIPSDATGIRLKLTELASSQERPRTDLLHWDVYTRHQVAMAKSLSARIETEGLAVVNDRLSQCEAKSASFRLRKLQ